jgi:NAD(P)-dependent dehydrogenase (short-subunit alcohol dehydrogenase family)
VNTSSIGARLFGNIDLDDLNTWNDFTPNRAYGNAKLANILFAKGLHERFSDRGLSSVAFHPGVVATNFASDADGMFRRVYHGVLSRFFSTPDAGGARLRYFNDGRPGREWDSGEYYGTPKRVGRTHRQAHDPDIVREHWQRSAEMLDIQW